MKQMENKFKQLNIKNKKPQVNTLERKAEQTDSESGSTDAEGVLETYLIEAEPAGAVSVDQNQIQRGPEPEPDPAAPEANTIANKAEAHDDFWILDSSATQHVTGNPDLITGLQPVSTSLMISAGGESHTVKGKGKIYVEFPNGKIKCFDDVLYVPGVHRNLLSVGCIVDKHHSIEFRKNVCIIQDKNKETLGIAQRMNGNGLYRLQAKSVINTESLNLE